MLFGKSKGNGLTMKVEIEYEDLLKLNKKQEELEYKIRCLEHDSKILLSQTSVEENEKKIINLAFLLFENYLQSLFKKLGFLNNGNFQSPILQTSDLNHWIGKRWYNSERIEFVIGANVSNKWRNAFLNIGILTNDEEEEQESEKE